MESPCHTQQSQVVVKISQHQFQTFRILSDNVYISSEDITGNGVGTLAFPDCDHLVGKQYLMHIPIKEKEEKSLVYSQFLIEWIAKQHLSLHNMDDAAIYITIQKVRIVQHFSIYPLDNQIIFVISLHIIGSKSIMSKGWIVTDGRVYVRDCRIAKIVIDVEYETHLTFPLRMASLRAAFVPRF